MSNVSTVSFTETGYLKYLGRGGGVIFWNRESPGQFSCVNPVLFMHAVTSTCAKNNLPLTCCFSFVVVLIDIYHASVKADGKVSRFFVPNYVLI